MRILIKNGTVIDPANHVYSRQNLWIEDGKIAGYGDDLTMEASFDRVIDASGLVAVPGFIDIHMHEDPIDAGTGRPDTCISRCMLRMGVTTVLGGNCGINVYDPAEYLDRTDRYGMPVNIALMAGQTWAREKAGAADKYGPVSAAQLEEEKRILRGALDAGCFGVSFGIRYVPGLDRNELLETAGVCGREKHLISAHVRDDAAQIFGAVEEFLDIGRTLGLRTQVSHVGSMGGYGQMKELLAILDRERAMGLDVLCDCYPYYAFSTRIGETTYDDGFLERYRADYSCIELCEGPYKGMRCTEAIFNELRENAPETITVGHVMKPEDVWPMWTRTTQRRRPGPSRVRLRRCPMWVKWPLSPGRRLWTIFGRAGRTTPCWRICPTRCCGTALRSMWTTSSSSRPPQSRWTRSPASPM